MVSQDFGSRVVEWLDMIHVGVWFGSRIGGGGETTLAAYDGYKDHEQTSGSTNQGLLN